MTKKVLYFPVHKTVRALPVGLHIRAYQNYMAEAQDYNWPKSDQAKQALYETRPSLTEQIASFWTLTCVFLGLASFLSNVS